MNKALAGITLAGRFQPLEVKLKDCTIQLIIDVAHNVQSASNLSSQLAEYKLAHNITHITAICGMMSDKAIDQVLNELAPVVDSWCFVNLELPRASNAQTLQEIYSQNQNKGSSLCYGNVAEAFEAVSTDFSANKDKGNRLILVFGSFITVANMLQYINSMTKS